MINAVRSIHKQPLLSQPPARRGTSPKILEGPEFRDGSAHRLAAARGTLIGILLGAASWAAIFTLIATLKH